MSNELRMYVVYDHPSDYPEFYVVRRHVAGRGGLRVDPTPMFVTDDLAKVREGMKRLGLHCLKRHPSDDPVIIETWL